MKKNTLFLVDDDEMQISILSNYLKHKFDLYEIVSFQTGEECLQKLHLQPDIIVLDYHLDSRNEHSMNGLETLKKIKEQFPHTEVIILTKDDNEEIATNCIQHGATDYIIKNRVSYIHLFFTIQIITCKIKSEKRARESWYTTLAAAGFFLVLTAVAFWVNH